MRIDRAAVPFVLVAAVPAMGIWVGWGAMAAAPAVLLPIAVALFFRDPDRSASQDPALVLAPADGTVMRAGPAPSGEAPDAGAWLQVTIFLSVLDVHINRSPCDAEVLGTVHTPGKYLDVRIEESAKVNESLVMRLRTPGGIPTPVWLCT